MHVEKQIDKNGVNGRIETNLIGLNFKRNVKWKCLLHYLSKGLEVL